jgi:Protein of unknown function (DUF3221)
MKNIILLALLFVMFMGVVYGAIVATGGEHSDMSGKIVGVLVATNNSTEVNSILVQGVLTNGNQQGNVSVRITNETQIFSKNGDKLKSISFENLKPGQSVDVTFKGPIIKTYPPQATGSEVTISNK